MAYGFIFGSILCVWAMLRVLGDQRTQSLESIRQKSETSSAAPTSNAAQIHVKGARTPGT